MENRKLNANYKALAEEVLNEQSELAYIKNSNARIAYLESDSTKKNKDKAVLGECEKVAAKNKWAIDYDFTITLFYNNIIGFTRDQIKILLFHELLHVGIEKDPDEGTETYSVTPHDLEDFKIIIDKYGTDWANVGK